MFKTKRKRAVVLALIAFFCVGATTFVAVDWKRFGGGFLAFLRGKGDPVVATSGSSGAGAGATHQLTSDLPPPHAAAPLQVAIASTRRHTSGIAHGTGGGKSDENLFKYGDPAAGGGIPPGSFIVAQNDNNGGGNRGDSPAPGPASPAVTGAAPAPGGDTGGVGGGGGGGGAFGTPAGSNPGGGDTGLPPTSGTPAAPSPPVSPPVTPSPPVSPTPSPPSPSPAPSPGQSGSTDPGTPTPPPPTIPPTPSAVPEASNLAMMSLGALFLAVAASRRRKSA